MEFEEVKKLSKVFEPYLTYKGVNLWEIGEASAYHHFLKGRGMSFFEREIKSRLIRFFFIFKNNFSKEKRQQSNKVMNKILFFSYGPTHLEAFAAVINMLGKENSLLFLSNSRKKKLDKYLKKEITRFTLEDFYGGTIKEELKEAKIFLKKSHKKLKKIIYARKNKEETKKILIALRYFCSTRKMFLEFIKLILVFQKILDHNYPKRIVVSDSINYPGKILVSLAKKREIPSITIQHGQIVGNDVEGEILSNKKLVAGEEDKKFLVSRGADRQKIRIVGWPKLDKYLRLKDKKKNVRKKYRLNSRKKVILLLDQYSIPEDDTIEKGFAMFKEAFVKKKDSILIIKKHPSSKKIKKEIFPSYDRIYSKENTYELILSSDLVITVNSTAGIEAALLGKPVISLDPKGTNAIDYGKEGAGFNVKEKQELMKKIDICLYNKNFIEKLKKDRSFVKKYGFKNDGNSTKRAIREIKNVQK